MFKLLKNVEITKAEGFDKISEEFLKDGAQILAKTIDEMRNLSMTIIHKCVSMTNSQR